jgi:hypothetical protein
MGAVPVAQGMTAEEFLALPDTDADVLWYAPGAEPDLDARPPSFDVALEVDDILTSPQLEGFELALGELFPE